MLDVGATIGGDAKQLTDFSILGAALARALFDQELPTVGLLNVGTEEMKGLDEVKEAAQILTAASGSGFVYHGFVEGDDIGKGTVDVVVTEGFAGNIALRPPRAPPGRWAPIFATRSRPTSCRCWARRSPGRRCRRSSASARPAQHQWRRVPGAQRPGDQISHGGTDEVGFKGRTRPRLRNRPQQGDGQDRRGHAPLPTLNAAPQADLPGSPAQEIEANRVTDRKTIIRSVGSYLPARAS